MKKEIIVKIAEKLDFREDVVESVYKEMLYELVQKILTGESFYLIGIGKLEPRKRKVKVVFGKEGKSSIGIHFELSRRLKTLLNAEKEEVVSKSTKKVSVKTSTKEISKEEKLRELAEDLYS